MVATDEIHLRTETQTQEITSMHEIYKTDYNTYLLHAVTPKRQRFCLAPRHHSTT